MTVDPTTVDERAGNAAADPHTDHGSTDHGSTEYSHVWRAKARHPERRGQACRVVTRKPAGTFHMSDLVEFADGVRIVASSGEIVRRKGA